MIKSSKLQAALARIEANRPRLSIASGASLVNEPEPQDNITNVIVNIGADSDPDEFLNHDQLNACTRIMAGESICVVGKAGTGKTTTIKETVRRIQASASIGPIRDIDGHKYLREGSIGIVCCAFTNRAINNISKSFDLGNTTINFMTIHKLLEYIREDYETIDQDTGLPRRVMRFVPSRSKYHRLPAGIKLIIVEEASMVGRDDLHAKLIDACPAGIQFVYLGDVQQLPPIYGDGILGYKLNELPVIELTQIYRQAAENPIIRLAWDIASGRQMTKAQLIAEYSPVRDLTAPIQITFWEKRVDWESALISQRDFWNGLIDREIYNWEMDIILIPYGKQFGSAILNQGIAQHLSSTLGNPTYEIISGFQKYYYAVGDKVLYNKKEGRITKITRNGRYPGKSPVPPSVDLHRDGSYHIKDQTSGLSLNPESAMTEQELDAYLNAMISGEDDVSNQASHIVDIELSEEQFEDGSDQASISIRGEYGRLELAYAITIHKAQGSEWRKVFLVLHNSHYQVFRESLYTAVTRASQQLFIICEPDSFIRGVKKQRIPGDDLTSKIAWFKIKQDKIDNEIMEN